MSLDERSQRIKKAYLGDSVYVEVEQFTDGYTRYILTTENGGPPSNKIYLEFEVLEALIEFCETHESSAK